MIVSKGGPGPRVRASFLFMNLLFSVFVLFAVAGAQEPASKEWFRQAKFGMQVPVGLNIGAWVPRIAAAGAKYVVTDKPTDGLADLVRKHGMTLVDRADYPNIGQRIPSTVPMTPERKASHWEARFGIGADSGGTTAPELIRLLVECAGKGGNLLLALPSQPEGSATALAEVGLWLKRNGESIYGTGAGPFEQMPFFGRATSKGNSLYLHLYQWPSNGKLRLVGLRNEIVSASILGSKEVVKWSREGELQLALPARGPETAVNVVKLNLNGRPVATRYLIEPGPDGVITAPAESSEFETKAGQVIRKEIRNGRVMLSHWTRAIDVPSWKVHVPKEGRYRVEMVYSAGKESAGVPYTVTMRGATMGMVKGVVQDTGPGTKKLEVKDMVIEEGNYMLFVQPENKPGQPAMLLERILLRRIGE